MARARSSLFWDAARELDPDVDDESRLAGAREGHLAELFEAAGLREIEATRPVRRPSSTRASRSGGSRSPSGSGRRARTWPASTPARQAELRERCRALLPAAPFVVTARAWAARGLA